MTSPQADQGSVPRLALVELEADAPLIAAQKRQRVALTQLQPEGTTAAVLESPVWLTGPGARTPATMVVSEAIVTQLQRTQLQLTTPLLARGGELEFEIRAGGAYHLLQFQASRPAWLRIYGTPEAREDDNRNSPGGQVPPAGTEHYVELATDQADQVIRLSPVPIVQGAAGISYARVVNIDSESRAISIILEVLALAEIGRVEVVPFDPQIV